MQAQSKEITLSLRIPAALHQQMRLLAQCEHRSLNQQLVHVLEEWLSQEEKNAGYLDFHRRLQAQVHGDGAKKEQE